MYLSKSGNLSALTQTLKLMKYHRSREKSSMLKQFKNAFITSVITLAMFIAPQALAGLMQVDVGMGKYVAGEGITFKITDENKRDYYFTFIGGSVIKPSDDYEDFFYQAKDITENNIPEYDDNTLLPEIQYSRIRGNDKWSKENGPKTGAGNWLKLLSNEITYWAEFEFNFEDEGLDNNPFVQVKQYVYMSDGKDFSLITAINGEATLVNHTEVPEPSTFTIFLLALMGFAAHRFTKKN